MGNRAVITTESKKIGVYVHWNGGRDSIEAFLTYCKLQNFRCPSHDCYGWARLCQVISNYFTDSDDKEIGRSGLSVGIDRYDVLDVDNGDNGVYVIEDWEIVDRLYFSGKEQRYHTLVDLLKSIDSFQPVNMQLGDEVIEEYCNNLED